MGSWWLLKGREYWLPDIDKLSAFHDLLLYTSRDDQWLRFEVILSAYAAHVITSSHREVTVIKGGIDDEISQVMLAYRTEGRVIAFRM